MSDQTVVGSVTALDNEPPSKSDTKKSIENALQQAELTPRIRELEEKVKAAELKEKQEKMRQQVRQEMRQQKGGMRFSANKMRFDLIPIEAEVEIARVYTVGAAKYDDNNWLKGMRWSECYGPLLRHLKRFWAGQSVDPETKCHHMAQVAWNAIALLIYDLNNLGTDDRRKLDRLMEDFSWTDRPELGMSAEELKELRAKYEEQRQKHKQD